MVAPYSAAGAGGRARSTFQYWGLNLGERGYAAAGDQLPVGQERQKAFPEAVQDVLAGFSSRAQRQGLQARSRAYRLFGASAGAHVAALAALGGRTKLFAGGYPQDRHAPSVPP